MTIALAEKPESDLDTVESNLRTIRNTHFSIFEEMKARLDVVMNATYYYVLESFPEEARKKFNPIMLLTFDSFFTLNEISLNKYKKISGDSKGEVDNYFEMRLHLLNASDFLSKGLPVNAANELVGALGTLEKEPQKSRSSTQSDRKSVTSLQIGTKQQNQFEDKELSSFWESYSLVMDYYNEMFRISFPDTYNPDESDKFTSAISKVIDFEKEIIGKYKHNDFEGAKEALFSWETFMKEFVVSGARITPV